MPSTDAPTPLDDGAGQFGRDLARQMFTPRIVGLLLCAICIGASLFEQATLPPEAVSAFMLINVVAWPLAARWHTQRSTRPMQAECVNLWLDTVSAGFWAAAMQGALLPGAVLAVNTSLNTAAMGGPRFMARGWLGHIAGYVLGGLVWGWRFEPMGGPLALLGALPALLGYPLLMGVFMHRLTQRLHVQRRELRFLSEHDSLSGVHNRRFFDHTLRLVFGQFLRHERSLALLVGDVDDFKRINDQHGHAAGDEVIRAFGAALAQCARSGDVVARLGGDEFVVLLFDANTEQSFQYARRSQEALFERLRHLSGLPEVRVSFGVAMARASMKHHGQWLEQADKALYRSKLHERGGVSQAG
jgi:diguanylate cyclase